MKYSRYKYSRGLIDDFLFYFITVDKVGIKYII